MKLKKIELPFQSCTSTYSAADVVIFSSPMDWTTSFRPGTRFAGNAIRVDSFGIEWYSPYMNMDLKEHATADVGDLDLPIGDVEKSLSIINRAAAQIVKDGKFPVMVGGEHLTTLPVIQALYQKYPDLHVIQLDAHTDLRDVFFGRKLSHATVLRRIYDILGKGKVFQFGIRSGDRHEFEWAAAGNTHLRKFDFVGLEDVVEKIKNHPVYITIDLDVLDPSVFPGTGTPEAGGVTYKELLGALQAFTKLNHIVGCDIVELAPHYDPTGVSNAVAAKTLRELVLLAHHNLAKRG